MTNPSSTSSVPTAQNAELWQSLKSVIANSSGFQNWCSEQPSSLVATTSLESRVRLYLRETLETLAY